jgi:hypothetical protein
VVEIKRTTTGKPQDTYYWRTRFVATQQGGISGNYDTLQVTVASDVPQGGDTYDVTTSATFIDRRGGVVPKSAGPKTATVMPAP